MSITLRSLLALALTAIGPWACAPAPAAAPHLGLAARGDVAGARRWLTSTAGADFSSRIIGSAQRWRPRKQRSLQAFGAPVNANWSTGGTPGVPLTSLGCTATDRSTNGAAVRSDAAQRCIVVTHDGKLIDLDRDNPTSGYVTTNLVSLGQAATFTHTYVTLSQNAAYAFVVSDQGYAYAVDLTSTSGGAHPARLVSTGQGACVNGALFADPMTSSQSGFTQLYVVANNGYAVRVTFTPGATWAAATFTATRLAKVTPITTPINGTALVKAPPVVIGGVLEVGDRGGNVNLYDTSAGTLKTWAVNPAWPIETMVACDTDDDLNITDLFATAGPKLTWVDVLNDQVYQGQNALVEQGGPTGTITPSTVTSYLSTGNTTLQCDWNNRDAVSLYATTTPGVALPECPNEVDINNLSYGEGVSGQPPKIAAFAGNGGGGHVGDATAIASASLNQPWCCEAGSDGSLYVANTNSGQVLYKPASSSSAAQWTTTYASVILDANMFYEICGTNDGGAVNIGNKGTNTGFRKTNLTTVRKVVEGNLGLYIICNNGWNTGATLFLPKVGVTSAFGLSVSAEHLYVLSRTGDPMGICVDRRTAGRDTLYCASYTQSAANTKGIYKLDSTSSADWALVTNSGISGPNDICMDDKGNLVFTDVDARKVSMYFVGGAGNTRTWGVSSPTAGNVYTIVDGSSSNYTFWHLAYSGVDPQAAGGCLYLSATQWGAYPNALYRLDGTGRLSCMAGKPNSGGYSGDGGFATAAQLNAPRGVSVNAAGEVYVCDAGNNRIRKLTIPTYTGAEARGYMRFNYSSFTQHPVLQATLQLWAKLKAKVAPPLFGVASPYLKGTTTPWTADNLVAGKAPDLNTSGGATITSPSLTGGLWDLNVGDGVQVALAPGSFPIGSTTPYLCVGLASPSDASTYYYGNSEAMPAGGTRAHTFHTPRSDSGKTPKLNVVYGNTYVVRPIASEPVVYGYDGDRAIFVANANAIFRYQANRSNTAAFTGSVQFTMGRVMKYVNASSGAWVSQDGSQGFQPNPAPPFFDQSGRCYTLDVLYHSYNGRAYYALNAYNADAAGADMRVGGGTSYDLTQMGTYLADLPATADENSGIFLSSGPDTSDAYFGLYNGRIYRVSLN